MLTVWESNCCAFQHFQGKEMSNELMLVEFEVLFNCSKQQFTFRINKNVAGQKVGGLLSNVRGELLKLLALPRKETNNEPTLVEFVVLFDFSSSILHSETTKPLQGKILRAVCPMLMMCEPKLLCLFCSKWSCCPQKMHLPLS